MATPQAAHDANERGGGNGLSKPCVPWSCSIIRGTPGSIKRIGNHPEKRFVSDGLLSPEDIASASRVVGNTFESMHCVVTAAVTVEHQIAPTRAVPPSTLVPTRGIDRPSCAW